MRVVTYPHAQIRQLVRVVEKLGQSLDRPVCSLDLAAYYRQYPDEEPKLTQALGQQLFKAARPTSNDRLYRIGLNGNRAYYAVSGAASWKKKLDRYEVEMALQRTGRGDFLALVQPLFGGPSEALARNAIAGWCLEVGKLLQRAPKTDLARAVAQMVKETKVHAAPAWAGIAPDDLIGRDQARALLQQEHSRRTETPEDVKVNWNRHLAQWQWPQSSLFQDGAGTGTYSKEQLALLAVTLWPEPKENVETAKARLAALRFGQI